MRALRFALLGMGLATAAWAAVYTPPGGGVQLTYDDNTWEVSTKRAAEEPGATPHQTLVALQRKEPDDRYHARFSVVADSLDSFRKRSPQGDLLDAYQKHASEFLQSQRFADIESHKTSLSIPSHSGAAWETTATHRDFGLKFRQLVFLTANKAVLVTMAARRDKFPSYDEEFRKLVSSIRIVDKKL